MAMAAAAADQVAPHPRHSIVPPPRRASRSYVLATPWLRALHLDPLRTRRQPAAAGKAPRPKLLIAGSGRLHREYVSTALVRPSLPCPDRLQLASARS